MMESSEPPRLLQPLEILPIDTSFTAQRYLVNTVDGRKFEVSRTIFELIMLIDGSRQVSSIASEFTRITRKEISAGDIERVIGEVLIPGGMVVGANRILSIKSPSSYLHLRFTLFTQEMIRPLTCGLHFLFYPRILIPGLSACLAFAAYFYLFATVPGFEIAAIGMENLLAIYGIYLLSTLIHELGHSAACYHFGARPGHIGFGLYLYFPVFYTDVSDVWKLKRTERAAVDIGGIYFQLLMLPMLYCLYLAYDNTVFLYAIYLLTFSCLTALNPLFRFDGYWLVSDLAGIPNLRKRSWHVLKDVVERFSGTSKDARSRVPRLSVRMMYFLYIYAAVSNMFFLFFIYELGTNLPAIFHEYPTNLSVLLNVVCCLDFSELGRPLADLCFPTMVLIMLVTMSLRVGKRVMKCLNSGSRCREE